MGCSRSSPPRAWLDHTRDGGDVLEHLRILLILILLSLVQHPCWWIPEHPCLHCCCKHCCLWLMRSLCFSQQGIRQYDKQRLNQEEEKQVHHLFISLDYSMHIHSIIHLWIETINWCNGLPTTNYQHINISIDILSLPNMLVTFIHPTRYSSEVTITNIQQHSWIS